MPSIEISSISSSSSTSSASISSRFIERVSVGRVSDGLVVFHGASVPSLADQRTNPSPGRRLSRPAGRRTVMSRVGCGWRRGASAGSYLDVVERASQDRAGVVGRRSESSIGVAGLDLLAHGAPARGRPGRAATNPSRSVSDSTVRSASSSAWTGGSDSLTGVGAGDLSACAARRFSRDRDRQRAPRRRR